MSEHTPEPWEITDGYWVEADEARVASCLSSSLKSGSRELPAEANARRIVACVNALAGISTETLEALVDNPWVALTRTAVRLRHAEDLLRQLVQQADIDSEDELFSSEMDDAIENARAFLGVSHE